MCKSSNLTLVPKLLMSITSEATDSAKINVYRQSLVENSTWLYSFKSTNT